MAFQSLCLYTQTERLTMKLTLTYPHLLQRLGQHVDTLLLVDEDDDGRLEAARQHLQQLLPAQQKKKKTLSKRLQTEK